ncbi:helicase-related protein [Treponema socranskii]|uniref:helicase-related protein n=1 Tax=Treponema socranskii TaxID=53419 RepID=UPI003D901E07
MAIDYKSLPVYEQKQRILDTLAHNQVIVVQSPTGSGKTTQIPVILYEAGYAETGVVAVTQPRRIAALSVSEFISKQLGTSYPGLVGYKMRFEDKTDATTRIKIMTDGILLQEMKLDPWMSKYSVVMVDEAHERSLNIDFVLGLLKRVLAERKDFKVIVSSATMNAEAFSSYFDGCPIVTIDTVTFPVTLVYDPPALSASTVSDTACDALLTKIENTVERVLDNRIDGGILIFLPGEKIIKDCLFRLDRSPFARKIHTLPLYGRLPKEEQERVFAPPPFGKKKIIISTNIAETSVTISDITTVIDSGLAKLNFYNPHTYTSSLVETAVSKASCNQRKGRAGRTCPGSCYRLYPRKDYETREMYTTEEIYRTDLSEVVLRMAELGITNFYDFNFLSPPSREGIAGAVDTLVMLKAITKDNTLSSIGKLMVEFPLEPRISRIIVEAIMKYPSVLEEALVAASFLSANSPFVLPPGEELEARRAHHAFRDVQGDFVSYLHIFRAYRGSSNKARFCKNSFLDERVMAEIENIDIQLSQIVADMRIPITGGGTMSDYLCCIAAGMMQFVCVREGKDNYKTLTTEHICIHPGSSMFRTDPLYIVAGEIVRTSRMFAMSVSPLTRTLLDAIDPELREKLEKKCTRKTKARETDIASPKQKAKDENGKSKKIIKEIKDEDCVSFGGESFALKKIKGKKTVFLPYKAFIKAAKSETDESLVKQVGGLRCKILFENGYTLLDGEKLELALKLAKSISLSPMPENKFDKKLNISLADEGASARLSDALDIVLGVAVAKQKSKEYGFVCLFTDGNGTYWFKVSRGFTTALNESLSSLELLSDDVNADFTEAQKEKANRVYRALHSLYES